MPSILAYHRPEHLDEAVELLADSSRHALAGGTVLVPETRAALSGAEVVDLQGLGLAGVTRSADDLTLGAMARLGELSRDHRLPPLLADLCQRELPSTLRNAATVGGTVALAAQGRGADSVLVAGLLAHDASVALVGPEGTTDVALCDVLTEGLQGRLIVSVRCRAAGVGVLERAGRTPADVPIVAAVAVELEDGRRLVLTGVAPTPVLVDLSDPVAGLTPATDFRGTGEYRLHLARTLAQRALTALENERTAG